MMTTPSPTPTEPHLPPSEHEEVEEGTTTAGLLRAAIRSTINIYRTIVFGSFPRRVPVKAVAKITDQIGTYYDAFHVVTSTHKDIKEQQQQQQQQQQKPAVSSSSSPSSSTFSSSSSSSSSAAGAALARKAQVFGQTLKLAAPQLIKSGFLGTVVFELYAETKERLDDVLLLDERDKDKADESTSAAANEWWKPAVSLPITSLAAGGCAGACHGVLYTGWEHGRRLFASSFKTISYPYAVNNVLGGTTSAHAMAHASLFGSFEIVKEGLMQLTGARHEEPLGVAVIGLAGGLAGICEEAVSHFTPHWETEGVSSFRKAIKRQGLPQLRVISSAALPTAVGFLAYEYGKSAVLGTGGDEEEED